MRPLAAIFIFVILVSCKKLPVDQSIKTDTTYTDSFRLLPSKGFDLQVGDSLVTPDITFIRISPTQVMQKAKTRQVHTRLTTSHAVPVKIKQVDKSKIKTGKQVDKRETKFNSDNKSKPNNKVKSGVSPGGSG